MVHAPRFCLQDAAADLKGQEIISSEVHAFLKGSKGVPVRVRAWGMRMMHATATLGHWSGSFTSSEQGAQSGELAGEGGAGTACAGAMWCA